MGLAAHEGWGSGALSPARPQPAVAGPDAGPIGCVHVQLCHPRGRGGPGQGTPCLGAEKYRLARGQHRW